MSQPLSWLILWSLWNIYKFCIHFCNFNSWWSIVRDIEFKCEWTKLFELKVVNDNVLVVREDNVEVTTLTTFKIFDIPDNFSLFKITICIAVLSIFDLSPCGRLSAYPLLGDFIQRINIMNIFETQHLILLSQVCKVNFMYLHWELKRNLHPFCSQVWR